MKQELEVIANKRVFGNLIEILLDDRRVKTATKYISPTLVVKATRQHKSEGSAQSLAMTLVVTFGRPNYTERKFIKLALDADEPFPIRKIQLKHYPKKKSKNETI